MKKDRFDALAEGFLPWFKYYEDELKKKNEIINVMFRDGIILGVISFFCGLGLGILIMAR